jgi:hypothetical protein
MSLGGTRVTDRTADRQHGRSGVLTEQVRMHAAGVPVFDRKRGN